jgi:hypothetical protein
MPPIMPRGQTWEPGFLVGRLGGMGPVLLDASLPIAPGEIVGFIGGVISLLFATTMALFKRNVDAEKQIVNAQIEEAKAEAKQASARLFEQMELRHKQEITIERIQARLDVVGRDVDELRDEDTRQDGEITKLRSRLDKGQRTISQQLPAKREEEGDSEPPEPPPMRARLPSRR